MTPSTLESRLQLLERRYRNLQRLFLLTLLTFGGLALGWWLNPSVHFNLIRAKGIILEDQNGRDRILIGAPIPFSKHRVRTDTAAVRKYWSGAYEGIEDDYMEWYQSYKHDANGVVVLNEQGFDRIQLGDELSDPNSGKRQFTLAGLLWNDPYGWELGGAGVNTAANGKSRSVIGLDDGRGEAVHLMALEDGTKGLVIGGERGRLLLGMSPAQGNWFQNQAPYTGFRFFDPKGKLRWQQTIDSTGVPAK